MGLFSDAGKICTGSASKKSSATTKASVRKSFSLISLTVNDEYAFYLITKVIDMRYKQIVLNSVCACGGTSSLECLVEF